MNRAIQKAIQAVVIAGGLLGATAAAESMNAAGATFPAPIYQKWFSDYSKIKPGTQINYQSIGSGAGIGQLTAGTVDFGASEVNRARGQLSDTRAGPDGLIVYLGSRLDLRIIAKPLLVDGRRKSCSGRVHRLRGGRCPQQPARDYNCLYRFLYRSVHRNMLLFIFRFLCPQCRTRSLHFR